MIELKFSRKEKKKNHMKKEFISLGFVSRLQVLRGLAYLRDKHQIMHRGKGGVLLHWISTPFNLVLLLFRATVQTWSETVAQSADLTVLLGLDTDGDGD